MEKLEKNYNIFDWWKKVFFKNYFNFSGRARRMEYWSYALVNFIITLPFYVLHFIDIAKSDFQNPFSPYYFIIMLISLATLLPSLGVFVRRMHDTNRSGWWFLIAFVPLIGAIVILVFLFTEGTKGVNNYGNDPKSADNNLSAIGME